MFGMVVIGGFLLMILIPFVLGRSRRLASLEHFAVSNRNVGCFRLIAGLSTTFIGGAAVVNLASLSYSYGSYAYADVLPTVLALVLSAFLLVKWVFAQKGLTLGTLLSSENSPLRLVTGLLGTIVYTIIASAQILALTRVMEPYVAIPSSVLTLLLGGLVGSYVIFQGYWAVTITDVIQFVWIALGFCLFAICSSFVQPFDSVGASIAPEALQLDQVLTLCLPLLFIPISQDLHVRIHSAGSERTAVWGVFGAGVAYFVVTSVAIWMGRTAGLQGLQVENPDQIVGVFLNHNFGILALVPVLAIVAVIVSTLDSTLFSASNSLGVDTFAPLLQEGQRNKAWVGRCAALLVVVISTFLALFADRILELVISALVIYVSVLFPVMIARWINLPDSLITVIGILFLIVVTLFEINEINLPYRVFILTGAHLFIYLILKLTPFHGTNQMFNRR